jgi:hypothetical protein
MAVIFLICGAALVVSALGIAAFNVLMPAFAIPFAVKTITAGGVLWLLTQVKLTIDP